MNLFIITNAQIEMISGFGMYRKVLLVQLESDGPFEEEFFKEILTTNAHVKISLYTSQASAETAIAPPSPPGQEPGEG